MPIRFRCQCGQKLKVGDEKVGHRARCPRCQTSILVPATSEAAEAPRPFIPLDRDDPLPDFSNVGAPVARDIVPPSLRPPERLESVLPEIVIRDDGDEWNEPLVTRPRDAVLDTAIDYDKIAVPRRVLYLQGILLGVVALVAFVLGLLMGDKSPPVAVEARPATVTGEIRYGDRDPQPDDGSVVIVLPADRQPAADSRVTSAGLRPGDPLPADENLSLRTIRSWGGEYARANERGQFQIRLPESGRYHVLVISRRAARSASDRLEATEVAQMGRFFASVSELIDDRKHRWQTTVLRGDTTLDATF